MKVQTKHESVSIVEKFSFPEEIRSLHAQQSAASSDEPFFVCDLGDIVRKHRLWCARLPRVEPFYAVKCNPNPTVIEILARLNVGFDCASRAEMQLVLDAGVPPSRIIYANPCKQASHLSYARLQSVGLMTFDSAAELHKIALHHPAADVVLRIFVGVAAARCPLGYKFGAYLEAIPGLIELCRTLQLNLVGVSFHVGSGCFDADAYRTAIVVSDQVFGIAADLGVEMTLLDLGGGFPGNLDTDEKMTFFDSVCSTINECLQKHFPPERAVRIIAEPGRYYVSSAFQLATTVTATRPNRPNIETKEEVSYSYFLNDGVYGSFNCVLFDHYNPEHYVFDDPEIPRNRTPFSSTLWGPTCDSMDMVANNVWMRQLEIGECVVFTGMGAYTMAAGSTFNGFQRPDVKYYSTVDDWVVLSPILSVSECEVVLPAEELQVMVGAEDATTSESYDTPFHEN